MAISKVVYKSSASAQGVTWIDATPATAAAADIISPKTAMLANGVVTQGTGSGTFVVTVSYNDSTDNWEPTCTFAQIADAYAAGKTILVCTDSPDAAADGLYKYDSPGDEWLEYLVGESYTDAGVRKIYFQKLIYSELGLYRQATDVYLYPVGAYTVSASGTVDIAKYASASVPAGTAGTPSATKGTVSNHSVSVTPSVTNQTGWITGSTKTGTAVTVTAAELVSGSQTVTQNGAVDCTNLAEIVVAVQGGGGGMTVAAASTTPATASSSIQFTDLSGEPTSFVVISAADLATGASPYKTAAVVFDGTDLHGQIVTNTSNANASYSTSFTKAYSNGTLTITGNGANFQPNQYKLIYTYGGSSANLGTAETQVGSGATSVTFTGLTDEPDYFSVIFKSNFGTSSGYQRVMSVVYDGTNTYGLAMDSGAKAQTSWSYTYSNGSLTVSSQGTNNGGYFHQPGYYQLTYGVGGTVEPVEIEVEPLSVTVNGTYTAPEGKAYSPVTVNVASGSSKNVQVVQSTSRTTSTSLAKVSGEITVSKTGTYNIYWSACRTNTSSSYTWGTRMYIGNTAYGTENTTWSNNTQNNHLTNVALTANDVISVYARGRGGNYYAMVPMLLIVES